MDYYRSNKDGNTAINFMFLNLRINPARSRLQVHNFFKRFTKFRIENCINNWIYHAVNVAEPSGQYEGGEARTAVVVYFRADRVGNVATEKW